MEAAAKMQVRHDNGLNQNDGNGDDEKELDPSSVLYEVSQ
jgi:hypothetical protein